MAQKESAVAIKEGKQLFTREAFDEPRNFVELLSACKILVASRILPKEIDTPEKCAVVVLTGRELGLRMMASTRGIYVVNGKPSLSAQMMLSLAYGTGELEDIKIVETGKGEAASCSVTIKRKSKTPYTYTFTVAMAKQLGKYSNEWLKQPENMTKQRALSGNLRVTFPDAILGMYTPDEIESIPTDDRPALTPIEMPRALKSPEVQPAEAPAPAVAPEVQTVVPEEQVEPCISPAQVKNMEAMIAKYKIQGMPEYLQKTFKVSTLLDIKASWFADVMNHIVEQSKEGR